MLARLNHANIVRLLNFYNESRGCFIVMEFAEGEDLEVKIQKAGLIPPSQVAMWFVQVLRGLGYAHKQGIVHRDLKPSNIKIADDGTTKLLDFGTAKLADAKRLTQQGMTLGTMIYMSKEQLLGKPLDGRSDLYSLGVTLYEATTGQLPFYDEEERKLVLKIAKEQPIPPSQHYPPMPKDFEAIILKSMAKEPEQRYQSAEEFAAVLEAFARGAGGAPVPVPTPTTALPPQPTPPAQKPAPPSTPPATPVKPGAKSPFLHPLALAGIGLVVVGVLAGVPLMALGKLVPGLVILGAMFPIGLGLLVMGFIMGSRANAGVKPLCPKCGRALLSGMAECPFCKPAAPAPAGPVPTIVPTQPLPPMSSVPLPPGVGTAAAAPPKGWAGETLNQSYHPLNAPAAAPSAAGGSPALYIVDGADKGKTYPLPMNGAPVIIGRAAGIAVTLNDPGVSSQHCSITFDGGKYVLQDLGSRNGCFINNQKVQRHVLSKGDLIVVGSTRLLVNLAG